MIRQTLACRLLFDLKERWMNFSLLRQPKYPHQRRASADLRLGQSSKESLDGLIRTILCQSLMYQFWGIKHVFQKYPRQRAQCLGSERYSAMKHTHLSLSSHPLFGRLERHIYIMTSKFAQSHKRWSRDFGPIRVP